MANICYEDKIEKSIKGEVMNLNITNKVCFAILLFTFFGSRQANSEDQKIGPHKIHTKVEDATKHLEETLKKHPAKKSLSLEVKSLCEIINEIKKHNYRRGFPVGKEFRTKVEKLSPEAKKILTHVERQAHELTPNKNSKSPFNSEAIGYFDKVEEILKEGKTIPKAEELLENIAAKPERPDWMVRLEKESKEEEASSTTGKIKIAIEDAYNWVKKQSTNIWNVLS